MAQNAGLVTPRTRPRSDGSSSRSRPRSCRIESSTLSNSFRESGASLHVCARERIRLSGLPRAAFGWGGEGGGAEPPSMGGIGGAVPPDMVLVDLGPRHEVPDLGGEEHRLLTRFLVDLAEPELEHDERPDH